MTSFQKGRLVLFASYAGYGRITRKECLEAADILQALRLSEGKQMEGDKLHANEQAEIACMRGVAGIIPTTRIKETVLHFLEFYP